jgi:hypothetical protein
MPVNDLLHKIAQPSVNLVAIADQVAREPGLLPAVFAGLGADKARTRFGCLKVLRILSTKNPAVLYPEFDRFVALLDSDNSIFKWGASIIIGNLAAVDSEGRTDRILTRYLQPVTGPALITAANAVGGAGKIALAKPHLADRIASALLQVESSTYATPECRNVALGHALTALDLCFERLRDRKKVLALVERQLKNRRPAVRRKAARFLREHGRAVKPDR